MSTSITHAYCQHRCRHVATVRRLGPRKLWDEAEAAYGWWYEHGEPGLDRFGFENRDGQQRVWLDEPDNLVRVLS